MSCTVIRPIYCMALDKLLCFAVVQAWRSCLFIVIATIYLCFLHESASAEAKFPQASASQPDLVVESIRLDPVQPGAGDTADIIVTLRNQGSASASGFNIYLYAEPTDQPPTATTSFTSRTFYGLDLNPGETFVWTRTNHTFAAAQPTIYAWVDPSWDNRVAESNDDNNLSMLTVGGLPTDTPTPTPTFTATPTPTMTPTPTATPFPTPTVERVHVVYLPEIVHPPTPVPTFTPTRVPRWQRLDNPTAQEPIEDIAAIALYDAQLYLADRRAGQREGGIYRTEIESCDQTLPFVSPLNTQGFAIRFQDGRGFVGTNRGVRFSDDGLIWQRPVQQIEDTVYSLLVVEKELFAPSDNNRVFAATENRGTFISSDNGVTWGAISGEPQKLNVLRRHEQENTIWVGTYDRGVWTLSLPDLIYEQRSLDLSNGAIRVWDFAFAEEGNTVYIGTSDGVHRGRSAENWQWQPFGLSGSIVRSLQIADDKLYAGREEHAPSQGGVWVTQVMELPSWQPVVRGVGWSEQYTIRDLYWVSTTSACKGLLAATNNGLWMWR